MKKLIPVLLIVSAPAFAAVVGAVAPARQTPSMTITNPVTYR